MAGAGREEMEGWSEQPEGEVDAQPAFHTLRCTTRAQPTLRQSPPRAGCTAIIRVRERHSALASTRMRRRRANTFSRSRLSRAVGSAPGPRWKGAALFLERRSRPTGETLAHRQTNVTRSKQASTASPPSRPDHHDRQSASHPRHAHLQSEFACALRFAWCVVAHARTPHDPHACWVLCCLSACRQNHSPAQQHAHPAPSPAPRPRQRPHSRPRSHPHPHPHPLSPLTLHPPPPATSRPFVHPDAAWMGRWNVALDRLLHPVFPPLVQHVACPTARCPAYAPTHTPSQCTRCKLRPYVPRDGLTPPSPDDCHSVRANPTARGSSRPPRGRERSSGGST